MHTPTPRRAFTLVELMVVIGIVATLMVLLLPAVNSAVESGRRTQCVANQTKLASAMAMYDSRNNFLPGVRNKLLITNTPLGVPPPGMCTPGWFIMLLPLLERQDLFDAVVAGKINFYFPNAGNNPLTTHLKGMALELTTCPSMGDWGTIARVWRNMHYRANGAGMASTPFKVDDGALGDNANGIYATMADIAAGDGSANTLLITEGYNQPWYPQLVAEANAGTPGALLFGGYWFVPVNEAGGEQLFGLCGTPTATTRIINGGGYDGWRHWFPASVHPGGAVAAFADGSTRILRQELQPHVYGHLVTQRSVWNGTTYSTNSPLANRFLQCSPATKPYTLKAEDY